MSTIKNLTGQDAVYKLRELIGESPTCMLATQLGVVPFHVCPMQAQQIDKEGRIWFFSGADSEHNRHIATDGRVQLILTNSKDFEFLTVFGTATIVRDDQAKIDELWSTAVSAWFPGGKEDPNLTLLSIEPNKAHYWETHNGNIVTMAKMIGDAIFKTDSEIGVEGNLNV
ncbi:pyridoxamine 5'-phosphate oxidase family protein [Haloferula chungangensis]|uniref:Pyridoxamine 5'-phosphate oxidase family protein n=1 Tax=Haloferula chungangensis TaxID=1048331 RepID=A0ABW2L6F7_9BACT